MMRLLPGYQREGFTTPITVWRSCMLGIVTMWPGMGQRMVALVGDLRFRLHVVADWVREIVFNPLLVSAVKDVLDSENILCWDSDLNIKPPSSQDFYY